MLVGYVSDERYVSVPDVLLEFEGEGVSIEARSRATGAVYAEVTPGKTYRVTLASRGYGFKSVWMTPEEENPYHFRLLTDGLLGYMWPKWVKTGEKAEFRVHAVEAYKLELYRYGWEKEFVRTIGWYDEHGPRATMQITPDGDYTQTGVQWNKQGYSSPAHKQYVEAPQRPGLYYMHASTESGVFFSFPWIVSPTKPSAKTAVLAANINWNAYNNFGGRSNYIHPDRFPSTPTVNARYDLKRYTDITHRNYDTEDYAPLSFDRPEPLNHVPEHTQVFDPIEGRSACHVAPAEWRFLGWMEREGFAYDLYAETQFHEGVLNLGDYRVLIITTHPEYWSRHMYHTLKKWVFERGGRLMYLGGNGLNCEVEFSDQYTMRVRNGSIDSLDRPAKDAESRFDIYNESEANLLGVAFTTPGIMTSAPYRVVDADHWVFAGAGVQNGDVFGEASLHMRVPGGASGHETDKITPAAPKNVHLLAKGLNADDGGADMVIHEPGNGGMVFSVGSITYPASILVDRVVSRITANVLSRFLRDG
ncbi:MAG: carboxypeptidase regulatory-like domain-containing protein [candidate division Zixibacteria bacterium]|nr:carboxypeptidase regulatory-like domain-containing protein [candidate division Zixibacteria bacterium]